MMMNMFGKTSRFVFEDRVIILDGFYKDCSGTILKIKKSFLGKIKYIVAIDDGLKFKFDKPKTFPEELLRLEDEETEKSFKA